jgi:hypothetical protein
MLVAFSFVLDSSFKRRSGATFISGHQRMTSLNPLMAGKHVFCFDG